MNVNDMVAAMAAKTVDAMVNVEPYNAIAVADGLGTSVLDFSSFDRMPVVMAATPDFVAKHPDTVVAYLKAWQDVAAEFKTNPGKVTDVIHAFFTCKGYKLSKETFAKALSRVEVSPGFPQDLQPYLAGRGRGAPAREEDRRHPGLEKSPAPGLLGQGQQLEHEPSLFASRDCGTADCLSAQRGLG